MIQYIPEVKNLIKNWENIIAYWEESERSEALANKFQQWWNLAAVQPQENVYPHLSLKTVLLAPKLSQNCYIMNINSDFPTHHIYPAWKTIFTIWQNMNARKLSKSQFPYCLKKVILKTPNFQSFPWIGKN